MKKLNRKEKGKAALGVFLFFLIGTVSCYWTYVSTRGLIESEWKIENFGFIVSYFAGFIVAGAFSLAFLSIIGFLLLKGLRRPIQSERVNG